MQDKKPFIAIGAVLLAIVGFFAYTRSGSDEVFTPNTPTNTNSPVAATPTPAQTNAGDPNAAPTPFITLPPHSRGSQTAAVQVEEFGDYQCPACAFLFTEMKKIEAEYAGRIRFTFSHFPIVARHPYAMMAVRAAEAAHLQGKFWEMHEKLYENQKEWGFMDKDNKPSKSELEVRDLLAKYAGEIKINVEKFKQDLDKPELEKQAVSDQRRGTAQNVAGTPALFMSSPQMAPNQLKPEMMTPDGIRKALDFLIAQNGGAATESKPAAPGNNGKPSGK
jgi:protein-disulfide isomerase